MKIKKSSELLWLLGLIFVALGVALCSKADLGVSMIAAPAFVLSEVLSPFWNVLNVGVMEYLVEGLLLLVLFFVVRRFNWRYLLSFVFAILYGYTLNFFLFLTQGIVVDTVWGHWLLLILGDIIIAFGVACFFRTYLPLQVYELFVAETANRFSFSINKVKWVFDISLLALSLLLATTLFGDFQSFDWSQIGETSFHNIGLGTLFTTLINSPLITLMGRLVDRFFDPAPRFPKLQKILKRN